jgi:D-alanyl-D-alanine carboxypeptidase (penicillin-binding protein 5/6)
LSNEDRLRALGERIPVSPEQLEFIQHRKVAHHRLFIVGAVVVVLVILAGIRWFGPVPSPVFVRATSTSVGLGGTLPSLPWPTTGGAALSVEGAGSLGRAGSTRPAPIAGLAAVMTAYVVLKDHPLAVGDTGPAIPVTQATIDAAKDGAAFQESVVPVTTGESLTELQALEGLLVAQGADLATLLADWDAGSTSAFVSKMNLSAHFLGLGSTKFTDPSGLDPGTVSTPADLIRLGEAAMALPSFAQIVSMAQVTLPVAGLVYNLDADLGQSGIVGIKTGSDSAANGCFLFESQETVDGTNLTVIGAVVGQGGLSPNQSALNAASALVHAAFAAVATFPFPSSEHVVGRIKASWGQSVPVVAEPSSIAGWPGMTVPVHVRVAALSPAIPVGADIGDLRADLGGRVIVLPLRNSKPLHGPSALWRLTHV